MKVTCKPTLCVAKQSIQIAQTRPVGFGFTSSTYLCRSGHWLEDSTPDLDKLRLRDSDSGMPATTRAMRRTSRNLQASHAASSRPAMASSSRARSSRQAAERSRAAVSASTRQGADDDDSDDGGGDGDDDEEDSSDEEVDRRPGILQTVAVFHPEHLTPDEIISNGNARTSGHELIHRLADVLSQLVRTDDDLRILQQAIPVAGQLWSAQLVSNMDRRFYAIENGLRQNINNLREGQDVVRTIGLLRDLFKALDGIRARYFGRLSNVNRGTLVSQVVRMLLWMFETNRDLYANTARPASAGAAIHGEQRLLSCFLSAQSQPQVIFGVINRFDGHYQHEALRLRQLFQTVDRHFNTGLEGDPENVHRQNLWQLRLQLARLADSQY
ncbi:hypothetical protein LTR78_002348 [Recurvomyces mirabilis]|uniref:Uncharacterized protein n=1 Tax=Recurvomyces mirabilis TaxID=574656 RepID=A0AAE0WTG5_9PEZI|nr:hypothetical protein LTR78_002348 [Recurvomyces mirabilis]KAK5157277.1 hypothetical protein LTS14_004042 [Recurvomyces mirabilis]